MDRASVQRLLEARDVEGLKGLARAHRRVLSLLLGLTYSPDETLAWRAVEGLGVAAAAVADRDPEFVRGILRRLLWSLNDESGGIGWKSPQALGAIVAARLDLFREFVPLILALFELEEEAFRPGTLWAVGHIASRDPALVQGAAPWVLACLEHPDPATRGYACWCAGRLGLASARPRLAALADDPAEVPFFAQGALQPRSVGALAREALTHLEEHPFRIPEDGGSAS
ncbi:MAG: DVU0298 family protein [Anaerolineae bacterium]